MKRIGYDIRVACMSAVLLVSAVCAEAVKDVGASLEIDSRLSLSEEQEYKSWASYVKAQLCRNDQSFGLKQYNQYMSEALKLSPDSEHLLEQWCLGRDLARHPERHAADLKPIWEEHPENVRLTMLYLDLLIQSGQDKQALETVLFSLERCGWRSGMLTLRYVELAQVGGRSSLIEKNLRHALHVCETADLTNAHVAAACYWRDCHNSEKESGQAEGISRFKRFTSNLASSRYRRKSLWHARRAANWPGDLEAMSAFALSNVFSSFGCWEEQVEFLGDLTDDEGRSMDKMVWWCMDYVRALRELKRDDELKDALEGIQFGRDWNHHLLETAAEAYLELKDYDRACEMFEMLSQKEPGNLRSPHVHEVAHQFPVVKDHARAVEVEQFQPDDKAGQKPHVSEIALVDLLPLDRETEHEIAKEHGDELDHAEAEIFARQRRVSLRSHARQQIRRPEREHSPKQGAFGDCRTARY